MARPGRPIFAFFAQLGFRNFGFRNVSQFQRFNVNVFNVSMVSMILTKLQLFGERNGLVHCCYNIAIIRGEEWYILRLLQHGPSACFRIVSFENVHVFRFAFGGLAGRLRFNREGCHVFSSVSHRLFVTVSSLWIPTPAIAQLVEHQTVDRCSHQMVPGSMPGGRTFAQVQGGEYGTHFYVSHATERKDAQAWNRHCHKYGKLL